MRTTGNFFLNRPIATVFFMVAFFAAVITIDQSVNRYNICVKKTFKGKMNSFNVNYVAWSSSNPEIISRLRDSQSETEISQEYGYFSSLKAATKAVVRHVQVQIKLFKRITEFAN